MRVSTFQFLFLCGSVVVEVIVVDAQDSLCARFCNNGTTISLTPESALGLTAPDGTTELTCGNSQDFIQSNDISSNSDFCYQIEYAGIKNCGCPEQTVTELGYTPCNLCEEEGDSFNPNTPSLIDQYSNCFDIAASLYSSPSNETICLLVQATGGELCGCSNPVARATFDLECPLCGVGNVLPDINRIWSDNLTCAFAEFYAASTKSCYGLQEDPYEGTGTTFMNEAAKVCCPATSVSISTPKLAKRPVTTVTHKAIMGMNKGTSGMMGMAKGTSGRMSGRGGGNMM